MALDSPVSPDFGGGSLPYDLNPLMGPRKVIDFQFVQLFLAVRMGVMEWKPLILFLFFYVFLIEYGNKSGIIEI